MIVRYDFNPYGKLTQVYGSTLAPPFGYADYFYHAESGLYLTHFRAYDPRIGRWLTRDPIGEAGGQNLYGYVRGNPSNAVDPWGLWAVQIGAGIAGLFPAMGGGAEIGLAFSYSAEYGFQIAGYQNIQGRVGVGLYGGFGINFTVAPNAPCTKALDGPSVGTGVDLIPFGVSWQTPSLSDLSRSSVTLSLGIGALADAYAAGNYTHVGESLTLFGCAE